MLTTALQNTRRQSIRAFSSGPVLPRITERRPEETGRGGRASDAGVKVCVFGATGFLGRYVTSGLGECFLLFLLGYFFLDFGDGVRYFLMCSLMEIAVHPLSSWIDGCNSFGERSRLKYD